jgi:UDP-N-acetylmuramoylalanine--D-glutamate ligase
MRGGNLSGRRVAVVGLGVSGRSAARALLELGAEVWVTEEGSGPALEERAAELAALGAEVQLGGHDIDRRPVDLAVVSPGIPPWAPVMARLAERGIETISEVELAWRLARCDFLAVTGTNGKTTTTTLLAAILEASGMPSMAAGNIGTPLVDAVRSVPAGGAIALEVSSFQLAGTVEFHPDVAVVLNVAEDHTDWHGSPASYFDAKAKIVANQTPDDVFIANADDELSLEVGRMTSARVVELSAHRAPRDGIGWEKDVLLWRGSPVLHRGALPLAGEAGMVDVAAAAGASLEHGVDVAAVRAGISAFKPLPHRLQPIGEIGGVLFVDDSKATNPHATLAAVRGFEDVVLIAGGRSKGIDLRPLAEAVPPVTAVVTLGEAASDIQAVLGDLVPVEHARGMDDAVERAARRARGRGSVLLSPGCASLDMFEGYAARGRAFARAVAQLRENERSVRDGH